mmetsp:Transcript_19971/g.70660  ORF Transcript_19971/g.70660 Transcript_19971/m.70660 type:complete len:324 (-) Transcript_19971:135-1106(-)|eukprot:CAMPEP_0203816062 /NCGR_PEP_ID=MMETSP0115-20131106/14321_1 /ASSEMBLY_ACC=CAM_ASM_000227 /TAXON_ID=33651 /ORGANISM="Bicosoecid sp, Strain ms1" /LENGTH=323 /DNA_ID=CAMNT_0050724961 /DNA_START=274 /DNA_END=1245 /DNA_ORIENTATION=+
MSVSVTGATRTATTGAQQPAPIRRRRRTGQVHKTNVHPGGVIAFRVPLWQKMWVGALSGAIGSTAVFPIDLCKTRMQQAGGNGLLATARNVVRTGGLRGLYGGVLPNIVGVMPEKAIKLGVNDSIRDYLSPDRSRETVKHQVTAGVITALVQASITNPYEVLKIAGQSGLGAMDTLSTIGVRGLYKGIGVTILRDVPYNALFFPLYEFGKAGLGKMMTDDGSIPNAAVIGGGILAGACSAVAVTPADVVKTRLQSPGSQFTGIADCARRTFQAGGVRAMFAGASARAAVQAPLYAIALLCFELQKSYLESVHFLPSPLKAEAT